jgi:hypothetical protein
LNDVVLPTAIPRVSFNNLAETFPVTALEISLIYCEYYESLTGSAKPNQQRSVQPQITGYKYNFVGSFRPYVRYLAILVYEFVLLHRDLTTRYQRHTFQPPNNN